MNIINVELNFNGALTYANNPCEIVLHHAEASNCSVQDIHSWHIERGWVGIGYHFFIRKDGNIYIGRPEGAIGAHCPKHNARSLGICFEGNFMKETITQAQIDTYKELIKYIHAKYGNLPVYGHKELFSTECPGTNFPLQEFKRMNISNSYKIGWDKNSNGWFYRTNEQGWYYADSWQKINGEWYSFDVDGYARNSKWIQDSGYWFYLKDNCVMARNEWLWIDGECYYFGDQGGMYKNSLTPDGYRVDEYGAWIE